MNKSGGWVWGLCALIMVMGLVCSSCPGVQGTVNSPNANSGGSNPGGSNPGGSNPGGSNPGGSNPGGSNPGGSNPGGSNPGGSNPGGSNPGGSNPGGSNPGGSNPGGSNPGNNSPTVTSVTVTPDPATVVAGETLDFTVTVNGSNGPSQVVTWVISTDGGGSWTNATGNGSSFSSNTLTVVINETFSSIKVKAVSTNTAIFKEVTVCETKLVKGGLQEETFLNDLVEAAGK